MPVHETTSRLSHRSLMSKTKDDLARLVMNFADLNMALHDLVLHCWVHSNYPNCGYRHMTTEQKALYDEIRGVSPERTKP